MSACHPAHTLAVNGLCVSYGRVPALREIAFSAHCGQRIALIGPNGAGKSTLLKAMIGLVPLDHGTVVWRGKPLLRGSPEIAYVPQRSEIDWNFPATVRRIVEMGRYPHLGWWRPFRKADAEAVERALAALQLGDLQHRQISALSGGQQQRAFVARALAQEAHVLLLDEPLAGLDADAQENLTRMLGVLADEGRLIIASHHDLESAPAAFDLALVLNRHAFAFAPVAEALVPATLDAAYARTPAVPVAP